MPSPLLSNPTADQVEDRVFPAHPRLDRYFASSSAEAARHRLTQCLLRGDGPALLLGAPGVGKTMLMNVLASELAGRLKVVRLASTQLCTRRALLQAILHGLGAEFRDREEGELRLSLGDLLSDPTETGPGVALLIDEAQSLPIRLLEELRLLSNNAIEGVPRLRLVLAGANTLDEAFTTPELETFSQRIAARCYLEPLNRAETGQYVRAHVAAGGGDPDQLLTADAYEALALASDGLPRLINQVADRALVLAVESGAKKLDGAAISNAWSDLHQLAAPWQTPTNASLAARAVVTECAEESSPGIEFGMLDEEDALQAEAEAVTRLSTEELGAPVEPERGVWDAGDKLHDLPTSPAVEPEGDQLEEAEGEDEPVSLAFPSLAQEELLDQAVKSELDTSSEDGESGAEALDYLESFQNEVERVLDLAEESTGFAADHATDPFAEDFDEEEVVLDPYNDRERVIPAAPQVISSAPSDLERAYNSLDTVAAEPSDDLEYGTELDDPIEAEAKVRADLAGVATHVADAIVIVESDEEVTVAAPTVCRQDYAELFANLRQG